MVLEIASLQGKFFHGPDL